MPFSACSSKRSVMLATVSLSQPDAGTGSMELPRSSAPTATATSGLSLLEKYSNLHADMEQTRKEVAHHQSKIKDCQQEIQGLIDKRVGMEKAKESAKEEQASLQAQIDNTHVQLKALEDEYEQAVAAKTHAQTVQDMLHQRMKEYRDDYNESRRVFRVACDDALKRRRPRCDKNLCGPSVTAENKMPELSKSVGISTSRDGPESEDAASIRATTDISLGVGSSRESDDVEEEDRIQVASQNLDVQSHDLTVSRNTKKLQSDWQALLSVLLPSLEDLPALSEDPCEGTVHPPSNQESCARENIQTSDQETDCPSTDVEDIVTACESDKTAQGEDKTAEGEAKESQVPNLQAADPPEPSVTPSDSIPEENDLASLFASLLQEIDAVEAIKNDAFEQAKKKHAEVQAKHDKMLEAQNAAHEKHQIWLDKISRQRHQKTQLSKQLDRLQRDVYSLQAQLAEIESDSQESVGSARRPREGKDDDKARKRHRSSSATSNTPASESLIEVSGNSEAHDRPVASEVRNPYLKQRGPANVVPRAKTSLPAARHPRDEARDNHPSRHSHSDQQEECIEEATKYRAIVSPFESRHRKSKVRTVESMPRTKAQNPRSHAQHPHRVGRFRSARGFGISLSMEAMNPAPQGLSARKHSSNRSTAISSLRDNIETENTGEEGGSPCTGVDEELPRSPHRVPSTASLTPRGISPKTMNALSPAKKDGYERLAATSTFVACDENSEDEDDILSYAFRK